MSYGTNYEPETLENPDETTLNNESISCALIVSADDESMLEIEPDKMPSTLRSGIPREVMNREAPQESSGDGGSMSNGASSNGGIGDFKLSIWGMMVVIFVVAMAVGWAVDGGPFYLRHDADRDKAEAAERRENDRREWQSGISDIKASLEEVKKNQTDTQKQVSELSNKLVLPVPTAGKPDEESKRR